MSRTISVVLCCVATISLLSNMAYADTITSSNFSLGFGASVNTATSPPGAWSTAETNSANTPTTTGNANTTPIALGSDFILTPTVLGRNFSGNGATFSGRVLADGSSGGVSAWSTNFEVTLQGNYIGALPPNAIDVETTVNVSQISIFGRAYNGGAYTTDVNNFHFNETTVGNMASSPNASTLTTTGSSGNLVTAAGYTQLIWDPAELGVAGLSASRNFNVTGFNDGTVAYIIDGLEVFGTIEVSYKFPIPEPSSLSLLGFGLFALLQSRRRSRGSAK